MSGNRSFWLVAIPAALLAAGAGYLAGRVGLETGPPPDPQSRLLTEAAKSIPQRRPDFSLPDVNGVRHAVGEWDGKLLVLNFWATWCPPCRREIPTFIKLQDKYGSQGLQFVGVAIDQRDSVDEYIRDNGINYPVLVGETDATEVSSALGNRYGALPYTVFIDRGGRPVYFKAGELSASKAEQLIRDYL